ncbi:hypothetical protein CRUP_002370, partial [Coryphaenoides rupestris]
DNLSTEPSGPNGHSFSSSSVTTYSKVGNEPPKVFQASSQTRRAPGGVRYPAASRYTTRPPVSHGTVTSPLTVCCSISAH